MLVHHQAYHDGMSLSILVYSDDITLRHKVIEAIGTHPDATLPPLRFVEVATGPMVFERLAAGGIDLAILDGEATPFGGMGVAKQVKDEIDDPPPVMVLIGRPQDAWLASWSRAEAVVAQPIDPMAFGDVVVQLLRDASLQRR